MTIPELSLVVLIGPSGSGKSTFAARHFLPTEVLSSDVCRGMIADDENDQTVTGEAFDLLHTIARKRLALRNLTVVDATNVQPEARRPLVALAREYHCLPVAIIFDLPESVCRQRNKGRTDRTFGPDVIRRQRSQMRRGLKGLRREGFRYVFVLGSESQVDAAGIERAPLWNDRRAEHGPFDIVGDVHGCCDELEALLDKLGYGFTEVPAGEQRIASRLYRHPEGRKAVFLGDLADRGPRILDTLMLVQNMVEGGNALCVPGNHDTKLVRKLRGKNVRITHGLDRTLGEIDALAPDLCEKVSGDVADFLHGLVSHYVLDNGKLVVAHAGLKEDMQGRASGAVREFALYGETTGETDEFGLPVRCDWAAAYRGRATVVYGHTPVPEAEWLNRTVNIDTGCVFGGKLTAMRYPEGEFVSQDAAHTYCEPAKPFLVEEAQAPALTAQQRHDDLLHAEDVIGKRIVNTRLRPNVTIREGNAAAALEVMSRFAVDPKWLIYLPPTMSPCETSTQADLLEHPARAFAFYRSAGVPKVVCQEKHMGSRAVVVISRNEQALHERFGIADEGAGIVYTRTGRRFFSDRALEQELLSRLRAAMDGAGFWEELGTDWACLDCELMPWSAKAQELLRSQYAAVGASAGAALAATICALKQAASRDDLADPGETSGGGSSETMDVGTILSAYQERQECIARYVAAYREYCWTVSSISDLKLAPFHVLATEGDVHAGKSHVWHMETVAKTCALDEDVLLATRFNVVDVTDPADESEATRWWNDLTAGGGEGMVVKPADFVTRGRKGLVQPALKVRGREYLRIIYGPEYTCAEHLSRLRHRRLVGKRSLALREFALGIEGLERFVRREPLRRVHECVFGVLAMESEPVDPRL